MIPFSNYIFKVSNDKYTTFGSASNCLKSQYLDDGNAKTWSTKTFAIPTRENIAYSNPYPRIFVAYFKPSW